MLLPAPALAQRMPVTQTAARPKPAAAEKPVRPTPLAPDNYDQQLQHYLEAARATPPPSADSMYAVRRSSMNLYDAFWKSLKVRS
jgi:hypothetical protein